MKKCFNVIGLVLFLMAGVGVGQAQTNDRIVYDLSGFLWKMESMLPGQGVKEKLHEITPDITYDAFNWTAAEVPGDVYTDLWRSGRIEDPHFGRNSVKAKWVADYEWWYLRRFSLPANMKGKKIKLVFDGVDYGCDVFLDGNLLGTHEGMFSPFSYDVTKIMNTEKFGRQEGHVLTIRLHPAPHRYSQVAGRKFAWHGDYWANVIPMGIWKGVRIEATGNIAMNDVYVASTDVSEKSANVNVQLELNNSNTAATKINVAINLKGKNFEVAPITLNVTKTIAPGVSTVTIPVTINDPQRWWPWDMGKQNLYTADISVSEDNNVFSDRQQKTFAIRKLTRAMNPGFTKEEVEHPWTIMINDNMHFMRSGTWGGPPDIFYGRSTPEKYRELVKLAKEANLNNFRIFGWHPTEIQLFYELCDSVGITVWQDILPIASLSLPKEEAFKKALFTEAVASIKQLRNHPCVVLVEGGEEILMTASDRQHNLNLMNQLGEFIKPYTSLPYIPLSPLSDATGIALGFKPKETVHANNLFYGEGQKTMEDYFNGLDYAAVPELAVSSCPNVESIKKFIPANELWPPGPAWGHHWTDFDVFRTLNFETLGDESTGSMQAFVDATQIAQGTIFQYALEHFRRRKPRTSAISICHYITFAPDMKWGIVDYYQAKKKSYDYVKRAYQPLLVSLKYDRRRWLPGEEFKGSIWVVNDHLEAYNNCTTSIHFFDAEHKEVKSEIYTISNIGSNSSKQFENVNFKVPGKLGDKFYVTLSLKDAAGKELSANEYMLLVADEKVDIPQLRAIGKEATDKKRIYGPANYYRYFDGLNGKAGVLQADEKMPTVKEFDRH